MYEYNVADKCMNTMLHLYVYMNTMLHVYVSIQWSMYVYAYSVAEYSAALKRLV